MTITFRELLTNTHLPRHEARLLLQHVSQLTHAQLVAKDQNSVPEKIQQHFKAFVKARQMGQPIAYLIGMREFYQRPFLVSPATLIPRPDTELVIDTALSLFNKASAKTILDLGTGSGIIAITLALEEPIWQLSAIDCSAQALKIAMQNARTLHATVRFMLGHWFEPVSLKPSKFDMIVANPPYIAAHDPHLKMGDLRFEPQDALTDYGDGLAHLAHIIHQAPHFLVNKGWLVLEHGFSQGKAVRTMLRQNSFVAVRTERDLANKERVSVGQYLSDSLLCAP
ncbi:MAG: peptide chain release factor N(5)-glutamine methyltransferase [Neisseriales bacterium]|nr:MAG: peptide chain release factor N(5)-glutamine methyltransferase [Neisseriales bacterium]